MQSTALLLENRSWQKVPGSGRIKILPFFRKPSVICSNSYVLRFPKALVVVDPGADPVQAREICQVINQELEKTSLPVYLWLTHIHIDHFLALDTFSARSIPCNAACHSQGTAALENGDRVATAAELCGYSFLPVKNVISLDQSSLADQLREQLVDPLELEIFHTPGHTPDSMCFKVGNLLLAGDLPFAASPGIAGIPGWDRGMLMNSMSWLEKYLQQGEIQAVLPGHGREMHPEELRQTLEKGIRTLKRYPDIIPLDPERASHLYHYALTLLDEAGTILSIIGGSLLKISYYLDLLEEKDRAGQVIQLVKTEELEELVEDFQNYTRKVTGQKGTEIKTFLKGAQFASRMHRIFQPELIRDYVDFHLLHRWQRLLSDYLNAVQGISFSSQGTATKIHHRLKSLISNLNQRDNAQRALLASADDPEAFARQLSIIIARKSPLDQAEIEYQQIYQPGEVTVDMDSLADILVCALEQFAMDRIFRIRVSLTMNAGHKPCIFIQSAADGRLPSPSRSRLHYLHLASRELGCGFDPSGTWENRPGWQFEIQYS